MAKINLVNETLKHPTEDVIELLKDKMGAVVQTYGTVKNAEELYACADVIGFVYNVLKEMDTRNKNKSGGSTKVVL